VDRRKLGFAGILCLAALLAGCGPKITAGLAPPGAIGYGCGSAADCTLVSSAECLQMTGGYCAEDCSSTGQLGCPDESVCHQLSDQANYCLDGCLSSADCREGYRCALQPDLKMFYPDGAGVCLPACVSDSDCGTGMVCAGGDCVSKVGASAGVGAPCGSSAQCNSGFCLAGSDFPGGYCSSPCGGHLSDCEAGAGCYQVPSGTSFCMKACETNSDCRGGFPCEVVESSDKGTKGFCVPPFTGTAMGPGCTSVQTCSGGQVWDAAACQCAAGASGPSTAGDLASATVTATTHGSEPVAFDVPGDAVSFAIVADGGNTSFLTLATLDAPDGTRVYDGFNPYSSQYTVFGTDSVFVALVPNTPQMSFSTGRWSATFGTNGSDTSTKVRIIGKQTGGVPASGNLDLHLYFVGLSQFDAAGAKQDSTFQQTVNRVRQIYAQAGVNVGNVTYHDVTGSAASQYAVIDTVDGPGSELTGILAQSDPSLGPGLNFFFVQEILGGQDGYTILGIAGGIPGPPGISGGPHSGVLVGMSDFSMGAEQLAETMAHEGGHFLGLYHTSESSGTTFDPLAGTPECPASADTNWDGYVSPEECQGKGVDNLMFWSAAENASGLVQDQAFVLLRNPSIR
jgi:hypothetical protein